MSDYYEALAVDYANQALIKRAIATVYLENLNDEFFWKPQLEYVKAGTYNFVGSSRNESNIETSGSAQCLKFKGLLSEKFFVCMDSDYRNLGIGDAVSANDFIVQTYTYSWENHLCFADELQTRFTNAMKGKTPYVQFDFKIFLGKLSKCVFPMVLLYLSMRRNGRVDFTTKKFNKLFEIRLDDSDYLNNGDGIIRKLNEGFASLQSALNYPMNLKQETAHYARLGLSKNNAYLRMRGHTLYNFINAIGTHVCKNTRVPFASRILKIVEVSQSRYTEMNNLQQDARQISITCSRGACRQHRSGVAFNLY